jgi:hypothetical protein
MLVVLIFPFYWNTFEYVPPQNKIGTVTKPRLYCSAIFIIQLLMQYVSCYRILVGTGFSEEVRTARKCKLLTADYTNDDFHPCLSIEK